jgi:hypothetical protein
LLAGLAACGQVGPNNCAEVAGAECLPVADCGRATGRHLAADHSCGSSTQLCCLPPEACPAEDFLCCRDNAQYRSVCANGALDCPSGMARCP